MRRVPRLTATRWLATVLVLGISMVWPAFDALAQSYAQLQVLLPGESPAPGSPSGKSGSPRLQTVGIPFDVQFRACDASWNTVSSITNVVDILSSEETATLPAAKSLVGGEATFTVTLNAGGSFVFEAEDQSDLTIPLATSASVTALVLQGFEFERISQKNQNAGQPMSTSLWAVDPNGTVVGGFSGSVRLQELTSFGEGRIVPDEVTLVNGIWSGAVTMYRADETSINRGNANIYAYLESDPTRNGTSDPFTVHPGSLARVQLVVPGQTALPGSVAGLQGSPATQGAGQNFTVDVFATDQWWNPLPSSDTVRLVSSDSAASTPVTGALLNGYAQFTVSLGTVGTQTLTVNDQTNGSIQGMTSPGIAVIPNAINQFVIEPITGPVQAGTPVTVTIRATDGTENTVPEFAGPAIVSANTGPGSISPESVDFSGGTWTGQMVFRGAGGAVSISCSDFASPPHSGTSNNFEVLPGPFSGLQVLVPSQIPQGGTTTGKTGDVDSQNAGSSFIVTVRAVDEFWNRVSGISDRVALSSSDPLADVPADIAMVNGEVTLPATLFAAGIQTITASDLDTAGIEADTSSPVEVLPGSYARLLLLAPGESIAPGSEEGRTGAATDQSINFAFTITVLATDNWWNPVVGVTDEVQITSSDLLAELPPNTAMIDGRADLSVRLSTGGFQQINASNVTQQAMLPSTTQVRAISSGFHLEVEVDHDTVQAGQIFALTVKVTNDAGSVIQEINSTVTVEVQNASTSEPGTGTLLSTTFQLLQGERTVEQSYTFAEPVVPIVSDDAGNEPGVTEVITVVPGNPAEIVMSSDPPWLGGNKHATVSAQVVDAYDNGVPFQPVDFSMVSGLGEITPIDVETDDGGVARADLLSARQPGIDRVQASSGALSAELDIETALVDPNATGGTVTNYPNPFHPGEAPTTIAYKLDDAAEVSLRIFTLSGGLVLEEIFANGNEGARAGLNEFVWDGRNGSGDLIASGGYILFIEAKGSGETLHVMRRKIAAVR